jgi:hypothetical protein
LEKKADMKTIASEEYEYTTKYLKQAKSGQYYVGVQNGGSKGAHQPEDQINGNWGFWHEPLAKISDDEAEAIAEEMGIEL